MQQRRPRLGDIVDDYCPRERRITNHAVVAMIEDAVKQTRCTTCDADHEYKGAKVPAQRRKKDAAAAVLADAPTGVPRKRVAADAPAADEPAVEAQEPAEAFAIDEPASDPPEPMTAAPAPFDAPDEEPEGDRDIEEDDGPVHRPLIRATLPRPEGHVPERKEPEFTAHQRSDANGNRPGRGARRGPRPGQARGPHGGGTGPARFGSGPMRSGQGSRQGSGFGGGQRPGSAQGQRPSGGRSGQRNGQPGQGRPGGGGRKRGR
jgi:hypothetical protein